MKTIITAEFKHETNRYCQGVTGFDAYRARGAFVGDEEIEKGYDGAFNEMNAFYNYFSEKEGYKIVRVVVMNAQPGPVVATEVWDFVRDSILTAIDKEEKVDGLLLALHGAMVTESTEDGEGDLLEILRKKVGKDVPIITTLDLHVNITEKMAKNADGLFPFDYYPHIDFYEAGLRAAECMYRTLEGEIKPVLAMKKLDFILPYMPTAHPEFAPLLKMAQDMRGKDPIINANICHGFFAADLYWQGAGVVVTANGDRELAQSVADKIGDAIFEKRHKLDREFYTAKDAIRVATETGLAPVTLADVADNIGAGGSGDATELLRAMVEMDVQNAAVAIIYDPETVEEAEEIGVGNTFNARIGGKMVPELTGGPVECTARVRCINDGTIRNKTGVTKGLITRFGKTAVLQVGGIDVIVTSIRSQPWDVEIYRYCGIEPTEKKILVVKSTVHFRASFELVSPLILDVETAALAPQKPTSLPLAHSRRPIYPLDPEV